MRSEVLRGWGGSDPDDLAVALCAALRAAGVEPKVGFRFEEGQARAIVVTDESLRVIAKFPIGPIALTDDHAIVLAKAIEAASAIGQDDRAPRGTTLPRETPEPPATIAQHTIAAGKHQQKLADLAARLGDCDEPNRLPSRCECGWILPAGFQVVKREATREGHHELVAPAPGTLLLFACGNCGAWHPIPLSREGGARTPNAAGFAKMPREGA